MDKNKGYRDVPGRPALFITTQKFLDDFSMKTLDDLPVLPDLPEIENISPELSLQEDSIEQEAQNNKEKLEKYLANLGFASRRNINEFLKTKKVTLIIKKQKKIHLFKMTIF